MKVPTRNADAFCRNPPSEIRAILYYGPNAGLVEERGTATARLIAADIGDPFSFVELGSDVVRSDTARLADEVSTLSLTGGRRVIRVREAGDGIAPSVKSALACPWDSLLIVEAGDLGARSSLRSIFETTSDTAAVPCYMDEGPQLSVLVNQSLEKAGLQPERGVVEWIAGNLGADRLVSRSEMQKLTLYMSGQTTVSLDDAQAIIGDSATITLDDVVDAAAAGKLPELMTAMARARFEGISPVVVLGAMLRHLSRLEEAAAAMASGSDFEKAVSTLRPPLFWKRKDGFRAQLRNWTPRRLDRGRSELMQADIACKTAALPAEAVCERALMRIAAMARVPRNRA